MGWCVGIWHPKITGAELAPHHWLEDGTRSNREDACIPCWLGGTGKYQRPYSNLHGVRCIIVERSDTTDYIDVVRVIHPNENPTTASERLIMSNDNQAPCHLRSPQLSVPASESVSLMPSARSRMQPLL